MEDPDTGFEVDCLRSYDEIFRLERNLLAASKSKGPFDPSVRRLRSSIRDSYEALILHDRSLAESLEIEQALWRLHYREIEGFRVRIRKLLLAKAAHEEDAVRERAKKKRKKSNRQEPLLRLLTAIKGFLGEATGFFHDLLIKIRLRNGLTTNFGDTDRLAGEYMRDELRCCMITCHRLLINLGDLARYKELYVVLNPSARDWGVAANHYKQAAYLWPASGQPYNQLAALCSYSGDVLMALYLYCRSLAVSVPYVTAWDNLNLLFEKNKQCVAQANDLGNICGIKPPTCLRDVVVEKDSWSTEGVSSSCQWFVLHFVKLAGILLTQSSLEELEEVVELIQRDVEHFLFVQFDLALHMKRPFKIEGNAPLTLQIHVILIFCLHHIIESQRKTDQEFLSISLKFAFKFAALSVQVATKYEICSNFPVAVIFMEWLASEPKTLHLVREASIELSYIEFCENIMAFDTTLINKTLVDDPSEDKKVFRKTDKDDLLEVSGKAQLEDHELLGFVPLACTHQNLDFAKLLPRDGAFDFARYLCWKLRYTAALQKLNEIYQESTAHDGSSGEKESSLMSSLKAGCTKSTADDLLVGVHPVPSLKEWVEKRCFPTDAMCKSAFTNQVEVQCSENGDAVHDVEYASEPVPKTMRHDWTPEKSHFNLVSTLSTDSHDLMIQSSKFVSEQLKYNDKPLSIDTQQDPLPRSQIRMDEVPLANANEILVSPSICRYGKGELIKNSSHISECCFARSSTLLKSDKNPREETEKFSVPLRAVINNSDMNLPRKNSVGSLFSQEPPIENRNHLDDFMHVKPAANVEASLGSISIHSLGVGRRKNGTPLMTYTKLHGGWQKSYVTQNPFVVRIKKCVDG